ncbi:glutathione S-transferase T3-like [Panicum hallii]|uniref:glutathione S-transferase T3-like n=1 Tax=Panicum hallii TaxID=206008 RepID=UPI000DF4EC1A|nr:glutathione S-transferase T3-like [Panicum hallii]
MICGAELHSMTTGAELGATSAPVADTGFEVKPISVGDDTNKSDYPRTGKRLLFTKEEDIALLGAWLNNSNDPIHSNYKKNEQYWKEVTAAYNSAILKNRARLLKQVKDRFGRIKKRVAWFCGNWKEANALWASGESDADLMDKALNLYEEEHKKYGPFLFRHCWDVLRKEPKWDAYLECLAELDPDKRKYNVDDDVEQHFSVQDDDKEERPIGGKKAKELQKRKRKDEACIIDLEDELQIFIDTQNKASEGRKEMLETQKRVSSENLEARKLSYLAAKEKRSQP